MHLILYPYDSMSLARERTYRYSYDFAARLTSASYLEGSVSKASLSGSYQYDAGGNLTSITEGGTTLSPVISGNRIDRIGTSACTYDAKGRQISSARDGRTVVYNLLDRPQKITLSGGKVIDYKYAADGTKLQEKTTSGGTVKTVDYVGDCIYEDGILKKILLDGAYASLSGSQVSYHFFLRDHLGSIRVVASESGAVEQVNHYYPYGSRFSAGGGDNRFLYTGKELNPDSALYDFHARLMSPATGRFVTLDPDAEKYRSVSPYAYCAGNPVNLVDSDGKVIVRLASAVLSAAIDYVIAFGEGFLMPGGTVRRGVKSGMKIARSIMNASTRDVMVVVGGEVVSNTFSYEDRQFKVNTFQDVFYTTLMGLPTNLISFDFKFRPFKTTTVNQNMKRARSMGVKYTPESYGAIKSFTEFSNDLSRGMNDVLEETANTAPVSILEEIVLPSHDDDDDDRL